MYFWPVRRLALIRRARMPRSISPRAKSSGDADEAKAGGTLCPSGISTTLPWISITTSIWTSASGRPVRIAFTSCTFPTLTPRKVTGLPLSRPLTEPGK